jgi:hypothetical protein
MSGDDAIETLILRLKDQGRSSPEVKRWAEFHRRLCDLVLGAPPPPLPLILAASGASAASKQRRLREQLEWAQTHRVLNEAIELLNALPGSDWESKPAARWHQTTWTGA